MKTIALLSSILLTLFWVSCSDPAVKRLNDRALPNLEVTPSESQPASRTSTTHLKELAEKLDMAIGKHYVKDNLELFFIEGEARSKENYVTLAEAMEKKYVKVVETGQVNQLKITNKSDHSIFIHSGDIVKGGKQDRTLAQDVIVPPRTKNMDIASFCVEASRWTNRGNESTGTFSVSTNMLSSRDLKVSSKYANNQQAVWSNVAKEQREFNVGMMDKNGCSVDVTENESSSSYQLALENKDLVKERETMKDYFIHALDSNPKAIGFGFAINGELYEVNVYNNHQLFRDLWPRLVESAVLESISDYSLSDSVQVPLNISPGYFANMSFEDESEVNQVNKATRMEVKTSTNKEVLYFVTTDERSEEKWLHKNLIKRSKDDLAQENSGGRGQHIRQESFSSWNYLVDTIVVQQQIDTLPAQPANR